MDRNNSSDVFFPDVFYTPPSSPPQNIDLPLDDDALSTLEKIYLFSRSKAIFHRIYIAHALPALLDNVSPQDAIEYVLPLLSGLAMDEGNSLSLLLAPSYQSFY
jgi:serine/threonine-protein phosphatase 4 regulatory subunit 1